LTEIIEVRYFKGIKKDKKCKFILQAKNALKPTHSASKTPAKRNPLLYSLMIARMQNE
jgi:hypothetical protein